MSLLVIILNVDADRTTTDPHEIAEALDLDTSQEITVLPIQGRLTEINFVSAEWETK